MDVTENLFAKSYHWFANLFLRSRSSTPAESRLKTDLANAEIAIGQLQIELDSTKIYAKSAQANYDSEISKVRSELDIKNHEVETLLLVIERDRLRVQAEQAILQNQIASNLPRAS